MITTEAPPAPATSTFPAAKIESCLRDELVNGVTNTASVKGIALPDDPALTLTALIDIDSLVVVEILCAVEPIVGFPLPECVVRAGGYRSVENAITHLLPGIEAQWKKRNGHD